MTRKAAMLASGGLVLAMLVAGIAVTMGITGPTAQAQRERRQPHVRTTTKTVTIHRPADGAPAATIVSGPVSSLAAASYADDEGGYEDEEDGYEDEDEGSVQEDHEDNETLVELSEGQDD